MRPCSAGTQGSWDDRARSLYHFIIILNSVCSPSNITLKYIYSHFNVVFTALPVSLLLSQLFEMTQWRRYGQNAVYGSLPVSVDLENETCPLI